ncbi:MAG: alpha-1,2-fucosyltransferase [Bacteroidota bacterium]
MIIVHLSGGLGNQMFQYGAAFALAQKRNAKLFLDINDFEKDSRRKFSLDAFSIRGTIAKQSDIYKLKRWHTLARRIKNIGIHLRPTLYVEESLSYDEGFFQLPDNVYLKGFWQSEKYFLNIPHLVRKEFSFKESPPSANSKVIERMKNINSVSVHVRRGDYISNADANEIHGVCDISYYIKAIDCMRQRFSDAEFFIFSDDLDWVRENLVVPGSIIHYMDHNKGNASEDLRLMTFCKHHIIANSSFSWWGAWLSNNPDKEVIAPSKWFQSRFVNNDIIPEGWLTL